MAKVLEGSDPGRRLDGSDPPSALEESGPLMTLRDWARLARAPRLADPQNVGARPGSVPRQWSARDIVGKIWNAPNTAIGAIYGGLGMGVGEISHVLGGTPEPKVFWRNNALQFTNNPFGGVSAITLGNTTTWKGDPYDPTDAKWHDNGIPRLEPHPANQPGHTYPQHEIQHTYQGEQLGPLYLPSNLLGGLNAVMRGEGWHGPSNWNERGPQSPIPAPWAPKS